MLNVWAIVSREKSFQFVNLLLYLDSTKESNLFSAQIRLVIQESNIVFLDLY
jgi:hypothetical protein